MEEHIYEKDFELHNNIIFLDKIAESIFDKATAYFGESFEDADLISNSDDMLGLSVTETTSNAVTCQRLIDAVKYLVSESFSETFDVSIERHECNDDEFPDDVATIDIILKWDKIRN